MNRRSALRELSLLAAGAVLVALPSIAPRAAMPTVGYLSDADGPEGTSKRVIEAFVRGLAEQGYAAGSGIAIEYRFTNRSNDRVPALLAELVAAGASVIVTESGSAALAASKANPTIPIVMAGSADPVGMGIVKSLERPGGNVTGLTDYSPGLIARRLDLLRTITPSMTRVGALWPGPGNAAMNREWKDLTDAARNANIEVVSLVPGSPPDFAATFAKATEEKVQGIVIFSVPTWITTAGPQIGELAARARVPAISHLPVYPRAGGLMSYGPDPLQFFRLAAGYVVRILRGEKPADMPVSGPDRFVLYINMDAAAAGGIAIPESLAKQADQLFRKAG